MAGRRNPLTSLRFLRARAHGPERAALHEGWVIANHILVAFHVAFISSVLALPLGEIPRGEVLRFIFLSPETLVSALFVLITFHTGVAWHELGHFLTAARLNALNDAAMERVRPGLEKKGLGRLLFLFGLFLRIPWGKADGVKKEGLNYYPDAPYNLAVAAAGPRASRNLALCFLPPAALLLAVGLLLPSLAALYLGRLCLGLGTVGLLDFLLADPGKYREFQRRERLAREKAAEVEKASGWSARAAEMKQHMLANRMQRAVHPLLGPVTAPWQFRNCGMGGRHTEKEYPESNISMQEAMFLILGAADYQEAQETTIRLQTRLKEIIENEEGCRVMGIGLEGGLAPYIEKGPYPVPELRLWAMLKQAIEECGLRPGTDVAIALDPALSELEIAYRREFNQPDAVGMYLFWRDKAKTVLDRDAVLELYVKAIEEYEIPILSIEDAFSEHDDQGWKNIRARLGDRIFIIGDDLVTTNDGTIERAADQGLCNAALIKANQIGTLYETLLAMLVALGKNQELVVSHRSKSPNDDMEAQIALAANALGLKCGGGANTERLVKYQAVTETMLRIGDEGDRTPPAAGAARVRGLRAWEEPTNAGIPTVGAQVDLELAGAGVGLRFRGATPLGTSAGEGEAIHLVDSVIEGAEHREVITRHRELFEETEPGVFAFRKEVEEPEIRRAEDPDLAELFRRAQRYQGKGCLTAVENVLERIAPRFQGQDPARLGLVDIDRALLGLELEVARQRGKIAADAGPADRIRVMQRKQNLGMNAILSASLALARAAAHLRGKELYELLREEMLALIERFASAQGVEPAGPTFEDAVAALRTAAAALAAKGGVLHEELRAIAGLYEVETAAGGGAPPAPTPAAPPAGLDEAARARAVLDELVGEFPALADRRSEIEEAVGRELAAAAEPDGAAAAAAAALLAVGHLPSGPEAAGRLARTVLEDRRSLPAESLERAVAAITAARREAPPAPAPETPSASEPPAPEDTAGLLPTAFSAEEVARLVEVERDFERAWLRGGDKEQRRALRAYLELKSALARRERPLGLVNNRFYRGEGLLMPWIVDGECILHVVQGGEVRAIDSWVPQPGAILTDAALLARGGFQGEVVDLEELIFRFDPDRTDLRPVRRLRDVVALLQRINDCTNRSEANFLLRHLTARLAGAEAQEFMRAKNLQPELRNLERQLSRFLEGPLCHRLSFLTRVMVRNLSALLGQPKVIDRVWNATIDLAEVQVRGSAIVNEIRRSSHHALGDRTLEMVKAYRSWLADGDPAPLAAVGLPAPGPADERARSLPQVRGLMEVLVDDLARLLGQAEVVERLRSWQETYADALLRCRFGHLVDDEVAALVSDGIRERNRWSYLHHLRILREKAEEFAADGGPGAAFLAELAELERCHPEVEGFDPEAAEQRLKQAAADFTAGVRAVHQDGLFHDLERAVGLYEEGEWFEAFRCLAELRASLIEPRRGGGFRLQAFLASQLDCLLEEIGYLSLRHLAARFAEQGVDLEQCLEVIRLCAHNLRFAGLQSRDLADLAELLAAPGRGGKELLNALGAISRGYHMVLQRVTAPFEALREKLGLDPDRLRGVLANLQRYMHDLNSMAAFADLAGAWLRESGAGAACAGNGGPLPEAPVLHLSDRAAIAAEIERHERGRCVRDYYGGKGSSLLYISYLNIPTRDGFVLPTTIGRARRRGRGPDLAELVEEHLQRLEADLERRDGVARRLGDEESPLLLAVRGGSVFSMPGILDTVLFLGMNRAITERLAREEDGPWRAWDCYRRFLGALAFDFWRLDLETHGLVDAAKKRYGVANKSDLPWEALREVADQMEAAIRDAGHGEELDRLLAEPRRQLLAAVEAVLASWDAETTRRYRELKDYCDTWHTAVVVQEMAFGNYPNEEIRPGMDEAAASLTGVVSRTRIDERGLRELVGDIKFSAAGEDLVGGVTRSFLPIASLDETMPLLEARLRHIVAKLRRFFGTDQEVEFTVERGVLSVLQCRTAAAGIGQVVRELVDPGDPLTRGIGVCGGGFRGLVAFSPEGLAELEPVAAEREDVDGVLLVLENPAPEDIPFILSAQGLMTVKGGSTAHAAVAANGLVGRSYSAVMSVNGLEIRPGGGARIMPPGGGEPVELRQGEVLTIHGRTGEVFLGGRELAPPAG
ncbi:MAG: hypothetical protein D6702_01840 [Planctomycetota bacterium]|nr:MAG: hypothetical protein D6702_01840 [Planctomycetota bacterium]